jgi:acetyl-CoA C-acetyltransferase
MERVYIVAARRTAIGSFGGALKDIAAPRLAATVIASILKDAGVAPEQVDETVVGTILTAGQGMGPARQASIYAGIPAQTPAYAVNMLCGSGMKAIMLAADSVRLGRARVVVAAGAESMSGTPYLVPAVTRFGSRFGNMELADHMVKDALTDVFNDYHMGVTAENIAKKHNITRIRQDEFAVQSQHRAADAIEAGRFRREIAAVEVKSRRETSQFDVDEYPRAGTTVESLGKLRPAFLPDGTVTAGNSSGVNDGASAVLVAGERAVEELGLTPRAEIIGYSQAGVDPAYMGLGPVPAVRLVLAELGMPLSAMDLIELNEAFAAQAIGVITEMADEHDLSYDQIIQRTNVNGGAIALGHPVATSSNRIVVTLLHEMERRNVEHGLASLCVGGGMGTAIVVRRVT